MNLITDEGKYYLYRHIREDKNEPFYIGIGTKAKTGLQLKTYRRSRSKDKKSDIWKKICNKTKYEIEILLESDDYNFIKQKEIEFIALYGRKDLGTGTLANLTDGGEGTLGRKHTEKEKNKIRQKALGKKWTEERKEKFKNRNKPNYRRAPVSEETKYKMSLAKKKAVENGTYINNALKGSRHKNAKLNESQVLEIINLLDEGYYINQIANIYNVDKDIISGINRGKTWQHLTGFHPSTRPDRRKGLSERSKLNETKVKEIKVLIANNTPLVEIAKIYNVNPSLISAIKSGKNWKSI